MTYPFLSLFSNSNTLFSFNTICTQVSQGSFSLDLEVDEIYTLTTMATGQKGTFPDPPASAPFPVPYQDNFDSKWLC